MVSDYFIEGVNVPEKEKNGKNHTCAIWHKVYSNHATYNI